jgi:CspA family cold shock protein
MATGTVKWFNDEKGYGFIAGEDGKDLFVHYTGIADGGFRTLPEGAKVEFEVREGRKGLEAFNVVVIGRPKEPYQPMKGERPGRRETQPRAREAFGGRRATR